MLDKAYVRFRENIPDNDNTYAAAEGFNMQGIPVVPFYGFGDLNLENMPDLGPGTIVCGNIGDVRQALKLMGKPDPANFDYPQHLDWMLGRNIEVMPLERVRDGVRRCFVKPIQQKLFTGLVWDPADPRSRLLVAVYPHETPCFVSDTVDFISEYRCFFKRDQPIGVKHYKGDPFVALDRATYDKAVKCCRGKMPDAYVLDMGVTDDGRTLLVESNDFFAVGAYGLASLVYARGLEARWDQLTR
jgi:hypothetical protein